MVQKVASRINEREREGERERERERIFVLGHHFRGRVNTRINAKLPLILFYLPRLSVKLRRLFYSEIDGPRFFRSSQSPIFFLSLIFPPNADRMLFLKATFASRFIFREKWFFPLAFYFPPNVIRHFIRKSAFFSAALPLFFELFCRIYFCLRFPSKQETSLYSTPSFVTTFRRHFSTTSSTEA